MTSLSRKILACHLLLWLTLPGTPPAHARILQQTFSESLADFSISTPDSRWRFLPRGISPGNTRATLRFESPVNQFIPNVTVRVTRVWKKNAGLAELVNQDLASLPASVKLTEKKAITHYEVPGYEVVLKDEKSGLTFLQWIFLKNEKSFVVTCTAKTLSFNRFLNDFKMILNSFEIR